MPLLIISTDFDNDTYRIVYGLLLITMFVVTSGVIRP